MVAWGAIAKAGGGMLKGRAKKVAADKLLGRGKKKPQKPGVDQEKGGALAVRPTTSLMPSGPTGIVPSGGGALATMGDSGGGAGGGQTAEEIAINISSKIIRVEKLLAGSLAIKKDARQDARKAKEKASDKAQEAALEKAKPKEGKGKGPKLNLPGKGLLSKIFGFFGAVILGRIAFLMVDWIPKITAFLKRLGPFVDGFIDFAGKLLDGLVWFIDWSYKLYDAATGWIKEQLGEEGAKKFDIFMGNLHKLIQGFLVWKIIGEKIFKSIVQSIKNTWKIIKGAFVRAFKIARAALKAVWKVASKIPGVKKVAAKIVTGASEGLRWGKNVLGKAVSKTGGLLSKGAGKATGLMGKFLGPAAKTLGPVMKTVGPKIAKFAGRIPILGPIIVAVVSLMSGEPLGQALFKGIGAALGGALGATLAAALTTATVGIGALLAPALTIVGEMLGAFIGDLLYEGFMGKGWGEALKRLKDAVVGAFSKVLDVGKWLAGGFKRFIKNFLVETPIDIPKGGGRWTAMTWMAKAFGMFDFLKEIGYVTDGQVSKFPNLLQLYNPFKMLPLLKDSFFPPGGVKEESGSTSASISGGSEDKSPTGLDKQEKALISANQKKGYEGVMEEIESYAPYEDIESSPVTVVAPNSGTKLISGDGGGSSSKLISIGGGNSSEKDSYEVLDMFG